MVPEVFISVKLIEQNIALLIILLVAKLNSTEMDFWRRSLRISRQDKIRNNIIKQKMNVTKSLLEDIKTKQLKWCGHVQRMEEGRLPKEKL